MLDWLFRWCPFSTGSRSRWSQLTSPSGDPFWLLDSRMDYTGCPLVELVLGLLIIYCRILPFLFVLLTCFVCAFCTGLLPILLDCKWCYFVESCRSVVWGCSSCSFLSQMERFHIFLLLIWAWFFHAFQISLIFPSFSSCV